MLLDAEFGMDLFITLADITNDRYAENLVRSSHRNE